MVSYVEYNNTQWPILFGHVAIREYESTSGELFQDIGDDMEKHARFLWIAIKVAHRKLKEPFYIKDDEGVEVPKISIEECLWFLDERWPAYYGLLIESFTKLTDMSVEELMEKGAEVQKLIDAEKKRTSKKPNGVKSKPKPQV